MHIFAAAIGGGVVVVAMVVAIMVVIMMVVVVVVVAVVVHCLCVCYRIRSGNQRQRRRCAPPLALLLKNPPQLAPQQGALARRDEAALAGPELGRHEEVVAALDTADGRCPAGPLLRSNSAAVREQAAVAAAATAAGAVPGRGG